MYALCLPRVWFWLPDVPSLLGHNEYRITLRERLLEGQHESCRLQRTQCHRARRQHRSGGHIFPTQPGRALGRCDRGSLAFGDRECDDRPAEGQGVYL